MTDKLYTHSQASDLLATASKLEAATIQATESRLTLEEVREAARAAGIDPRYVDAAMHSSAGRDLEERWLGVPINTVRTLIVVGHLDDETWGQVVAAIRDCFGAEGNAETIGNSRRWSHSKTVVTAEPAGDDTLVHIKMDRAAVAKGMGYSSMAMAGTGVLLATIGLLTSSAEGPLLTAAMMALLAVIYGSVAFVVPPLQHKAALKSIDELANRLASISGVATPGEESTSLPDPQGKSILEDDPVSTVPAGASITRLRGR